MSTLCGLKIGANGFGSLGSLLRVRWRVDSRGLGVRDWDGKENGGSLIEEDVNRTSLFLSIMENPLNSATKFWSCKCNS